MNRPLLEPHSPIKIVARSSTHGRRCFSLADRLSVASCDRCKWMHGSGEGKKGIQYLVEYSYWIPAGLEFQLDTWNLNDLLRGIQTSCIILYAFCNCLQLDHSHTRISVPFLFLGCPGGCIASLIFLPQHVLRWGSWLLVITVLYSRSVKTQSY